MLLSELPMGVALSFVFYDTETTGTDTAFDQILQFAAIKTDEHFNELETFNVRCRIKPYVVPSPAALLITGVRPHLLVDKKLPTHYEAIRAIRARLLAWSPATFLGYNSISFDEDLLREAFFQTLHPAYLTNTNNNARSDVMRIANAVSIYVPKAISVPLDARGKQSFKLDRLAPANGFKHDNAHDALADVKATIHLAKLLRTNAPEIWEAMSRTSRKNAAIDYVQSLPILSLTERSFGRNSSWLVSACGSNPDNSGQMAVFDLSFNPDEYLDLTIEKLIDVLNAKTKPIRTVRTNAQPIVMPAASAPASTKALAVPEDELKRRAAVIATNASFQFRVGEALSRRFAVKEPYIHVEQRIYDGFPSVDDNVLMEKFHISPWRERLCLVDKMEDARIIEHSRRLFYSECPAILIGSESSKMKDWVLDRITTTAEVPWTTIPKALASLEELEENADENNKSFLSEIRAHIEDMPDKIATG